MFGVSLRAVGAFLFMALRPLPRAVNTAVNIGTGVGGLLLVSLGVAKAGSGESGVQILVWPWGVLGLLAGSLILVSFAGIRLELSRLLANQVSLYVEPLDPESVGPRPYSYGADEWTQQLLVRNHGPAGRFRASVGTVVFGIQNQSYGQGVEVAWEQDFDSEHAISRDGMGTLRVSSTYAYSGKTVLRIWIPPSPYSGQDYGLGAEQTVIGHEIRFDLRLTDVERDVSRLFRVSMVLAADGKPTTSAVEVTGASSAMKRSASSPRTNTSSESPSVTSGDGYQCNSKCVSPRHGRSRCTSSDRT